MADKFTIGEAALRTGIKVATIRYYEQIGLLAAPVRSAGNRRHYQADDLKRLSFIRHARDLGFEIQAIRRLLSLQDHPQRSCEDIDQLVHEHLLATEDKIARLTSLRRELDRMLASCHGGIVAECRVIDAIAKVDP